MKLDSYHVIYTRARWNKQAPFNIRATATWSKLITSTKKKEKRKIPSSVINRKILEPKTKKRKFFTRMVCCLGRCGSYRKNRAARTMYFFTCVKKLQDYGLDILGNARSSGLSWYHWIFYEPAFPREKISLYRFGNWYKI